MSAAVLVAYVLGMIAGGAMSVWLLAIVSIANLTRSRQEAQARERNEP